MLTSYLHLHCNKIGEFFFTFIAVQKDIFIFHIAYGVQKKEVDSKETWPNGF
jgi:hypothetical protein